MMVLPVNKITANSVALRQHYRPIKLEKNKDR